MIDLAVLGLVRDSERMMPGFLRSLEQLNRSGISAHAYLGENGSRDATRAALAESLHVTIVDTDAMSQLDGRLSRMALGRQLVLDAARAADASHVLVIDTDEPFLQALTSASVRRVVQRLDTEPIFAVGATSRPTFYDLLAFERPGLDFGGLEQEIQSRRGSPLRYYRYFRDHVYAWQRRLTSEGDMMCTSSFNGAAFYRADTYFSGSYMAVGTPSICEHVVFHRRIADASGTQMVVDGDLVLPTPDEHGPQTFRQFLARRIRKQIRQFRPGPMPSHR